MKKYFLTIFLLLPLAGFASRQIPDIIIYNDTEYHTLSFVLEAYFAAYPERRPEVQQTITSLNRGYIATYEIVNNELILIDLKSDVNEDFTGSQFISIFNNYFEAGAKITISGTIAIINGESAGVHVGFNPIYQSYIILEVVNGDVVSSHIVNSYQYLQLLIEEAAGYNDWQNYLITVLDKLIERNNLLELAGNFGE
ncbi:MAG: hypothetical protein FWE37_05155 [Spirochaetaceae bacterium]|nr:hypothetical protein [Spirochaetaceae bacterium]